MRNEIISNAPFVRLVIPLIGGIALGLNLRFPTELLFILLCITTSSTVLFGILGKSLQNFRYRWIFGICMNTCICMYGCWIATNTINRHSKIPSNQTFEFTAIIAEPPVWKEKTIRCFAKVEQIKPDRQFYGINETVLLVFQRNRTDSLKVGDAMLIKSKFTEIDVSGNPYDFNYRKYLAYRGIYRTSFIDSLSRKLLASNQLPYIWLFTYRLRDHLIDILRQNGLHDNELGVASALIIGDKSLIDNEVIQAYTASGTMHLLAVSGMHVALIFGLLNIILVFRSRNKAFAVLKALIMLSVIWFFALLTGLSASVVRAAVMCSFIIVGTAFNRDGSIYNSLASSAFLLLIYDPTYLVDAGFQLSYLAVLSIVAFNPIISNWYEPKTWGGHLLWETITVTIAAQILTTPISLYYFHQFPNLFLLSNIVMIPLSTIIIYVTIFLFSISWWQFPSAIVGKVNEALLWSLNKFVLWIENIPYAVAHGYYLDVAWVLLLYVLIISLALYFIQKKGGYLILSLLSIVLMMGASLFESYKQTSSNEITVYNLRNNSAIQFRHQNKNIWLVKSVDANTIKYIQLATYSHQTNQVYLIDSIARQSQANGLFLSDNLWLKGDFIQFGTKTIRLLDGDMQSDIQAHSSIWYILKTKLKRSDTIALKQSKPDLVLIDRNVSFYTQEKLQQFTTVNKLKTYRIKDFGACYIKSE